MFIEVEETPNPNGLKFILPEAIANDGYRLEINKDGFLNRFSREIFDIGSVVKIMISSNFITIIKDPETDWVIIKPQVITVIVNHLNNKIDILDQYLDRSEGGDENKTDSTLETKTKEEVERYNNFTEIEKEIYDLIDERVRPAVQMDGGDVSFERFELESGTVFLKLQGACDGCPSSSATLENGILRMLEYYIPEVKTIREV